MANSKVQLTVGATMSHADSKILCFLNYFGEIESMKRIFAILLALALVFAACHPRPSGNGKETPSISESTPTKMETDTTLNKMGGKETCLGPKTVRGRLYHTKGRLGSLDKYILSGQYLSEEGQGYHWKPEFEAMVGKEVEAKGVHYRYRCGPIEQCLEGGVIDYLREIEYLKAVE
jgi:hypothetical protein